MSIHQIDPIQALFSRGVGDPDYRVAEMDYVYHRNSGQIFTRLFLKDDGAEVNRGERRPYLDMEISRMCDNLNDLLLWKSSIPRLLSLVKRHSTDGLSLS